MFLEQLPLTPERDLPNHSCDKKAKHCEEAGTDTVKAFIFYVRDCTCQYKQHVIKLKEDTHTEHKYAFARVCACANVLHKIACAPTQNTHTFEHRGK